MQHPYDGVPSWDALIGNEYDAPDTARDDTFEAPELTLPEGVSATRAVRTATLQPETADADFGTLVVDEEPAISRAPRDDRDLFAGTPPIRVKTADSLAAERQIAFRAEEAGLHRRTEFSVAFLRAAAVDNAQAGKLGGKPPVEQLDTYPYPDVDEARVAFIGACAGGLAASYLVQRGFDPANMSLIDPKGRQAGIWNSELAEGGINNPGPLFFPPRHALDNTDRRGSNMRDFLWGISDEHLREATYVQESALDLRRNGDNDAWEIATDQANHIEADYVVISNGAPRPRRIDSGRIKSNLDYIGDNVPDDELVVERWQRTLSDEELSSGRPLVMLGLGNSTGTMLKQIFAFEDRTGISVPYAVLTDKPHHVAAYPDRALPGQLPIFRKPKEGYFTGYSGDLKADRDAYFRALLSRRIITGVKAVNFMPGGSGLLRIATNEQKRVHFETPRVFALLGYDRDPALFRAVGAQTVSGVIRKTTEGPHVREADGALQTAAHGYSSNLFALGAAAATKDNTRASVMPGVIATLPGLALTQATREYGRQNRPASRSLFRRR